MKCGKKNCKCSKGELHGPYWYSYSHENGKGKYRYAGKTLLDETELLRVLRGS
jgi:hypothetical protein